MNQSILERVCVCLHFSKKTDALVYFYWHPLGDPIQQNVLGATRII